MLERQTQLTSEILRYLIMHPDAKDGPEGIKRWWLSTQSGVPSDEEIEEALEFIVSQGWLEERSVTSSQIIFAVKRDSLKSAADYLQQQVDL